MRSKVAILSDDDDQMAIQQETAVQLPEPILEAWVISNKKSLFRYIDITSDNSGSKILTLTLTLTFNVCLCLTTPWWQSSFLPIFPLPFPLRRGPLWTGSTREGQRATPSEGCERAAWRFGDGGDRDSRTQEACECEALENNTHWDKILVLCMNYASTIGTILPLHSNSIPIR